MSANPVIPRDVVKVLSEDCAKELGRFQGIAKRLLDGQPRLVRFFRDNLPVMPGQSGEVSLYLLAVILQIFNQCGGRMPKVSDTEIRNATNRILAQAKGWLPADESFPSKVREIAGRGQPHVLDEALHALFERTERKAEEVDIPPDQGALMFLMLWAATEALDDAWRAPAKPDWLAPAEA